MLMAVLGQKNQSNQLPITVNGEPLQNSKTKEIFDSFGKIGEK